MHKKEDRTAGLVRELGQLLQEIPEDPTAERVHQLRTTVRRLEAIHNAATPQTDVSSGSELKGWKRISKVRKRAGKVRDFDVQVTALRSLRLESGVRDKARLLNALEKGRAKQTKKLVKAIEELPRKGVAKVSERLLADASAIPALERQQQEQWIAEALDGFARAYESHQPFQEGNLHAFRMECKRVRYRAEIADTDRRAQAIVKQIKKIQDAIGDWHDWLTLTESAEKLLQNGSPSALLTALRAQTHARFLHALQKVEEVRTALGDSGPTARKPPSSAGQTKSAVA